MVKAVLFFNTLIINPKTLNVNHWDMGWFDILLSLKEEGFLLHRTAYADSPQAGTVCPTALSLMFFAAL
jgi:hypothetical protein